MVATPIDATVRKKLNPELKIPNQTTINAFNEQHEKVTLDELRDMFGKT
ncbi:MAG: hypothetical protein L3J70_03830 [Gammaproteobacteria bacterium]|nr:hypothetical protein [Gammaproteobacteria bacterium]